MILVLSRGAYCPKDRRRHEGLVQLHRELEVGYCRLLTVSTDNITVTNEYAAESRPTGLSSPTRDAKSKKISTLLSTPILATIP